MQLHRDSTELNKHDPKGFSSATNSSNLVRNERGESEYFDLKTLPNAAFVDGNNPPPSTVLDDVYVIEDGGGGVVDAGWGANSFNDWLRYNGTAYIADSPEDGDLCYDTSAGQLKIYTTASGWNAVGSGGGSGNNFSNTNLTFAASRSHNLSGNSVRIYAGETILDGENSAQTETALHVRNAGLETLFDVRNNGSIVQSVQTTVIGDSDLVNDSMNFYVQSGVLKGRYKENLLSPVDISVGENLANTDLTLTGNRTHDLDGDTLTFDNGQLTIQGSGTTDATTSFLVENSSGDNHFKVFDNGEIAIGRSTMAGGEYISVEASMFGTYRNLYFKNTNTGSNSASCWLMENGNTQRTYMGMGAGTSTTPEVQDRAILWATSSPSVTDGVAIVAESSSIANAANVDISFVVGPLAGGAYSEAIRIDRDSDANLNKSSILFSNEASAALVGSARITAELLSETGGSRDSELQFFAGDDGVMTQRMTIEHNAINITPQAATAVPGFPSDGDFVYVNTTDATFTSVGFWGYENGSWVKL